MRQHHPDCSLRQGAGGTEFARFGSRTCFLRCFYKHSQTYFGQKSEEHVKTIKTLSGSQKRRFLGKMCYLKRGVFFLKLSRSSWARAGPIWAHKNPYGPIWAYMGRYGPEESQKICKKFACIGACKVPCTLP